MNYYYDIETVSKSPEEIDKLMPDDIKNPRLPQELERVTVPDFQHGSLKDVAKLQAWKEDKVAKFHEAHREKIAKWNKEAMDAKLSFIEKAALSAATGEIKLFGFRDEDGVSTIMVSEPCKWTKEEASILSGMKEDLRVLPFASEADMLRNAIAFSAHCVEASGQLIGFNSNKFDMPFIKRRCWARRVKLSFETMSGRYINSRIFVDLREVWQSGDNQTVGSMSAVAKALGIEEAKTTVNGKSMGANFGEAWKQDRIAAILYNNQDLIITQQIAEAMGV